MNKETVEFVAVLIKIAVIGAFLVGCIVLGLVLTFIL